MGDNTTHSALSPSGRHRWGVCPGSIREEAKYPDPPDSPAALDGTRTHAILEYCIKSNLIGPLHLIGTEFTYPNDDGTTDTFRVDADRANRVNQAIEYIRERVKETGSTPIAEKRVHPDGLVLRADMSGTVDCQIPDKSVYEVIDYKDGMAPVVAKDNPQLEQYAMGVLAELPVEQYPKKFRLTILQPKLAMKGMPWISSHEITVSELLEKVEIAKAQAAATDDPNAPLVPGESQCKYCKAKGACAALANKAMNEVNVMFGAVPSFTRTGVDVTPGSVEVPPVPGAVMVEPGEWMTLEPAQQAAQQDPHTMTDEQLRQVAEAAPLMRSLIEGVEKEIQRRLEAGIAVPGFKLVNGRGTRKWALSEEEMVKKLTGMGIPKSACYVTTLISPAQAEKLTWEKKGEITKLSDTQIKRMNNEYITTIMGKPSVAPESDPRPAVITNAAPLFGDITKQTFEVEAPAFLAPQSVPSPAEVVQQASEIVSQQFEMPAWLQVPAWLQ
jgi:hypothetical protein